MKKYYYVIALCFIVGLIAWRWEIWLNNWMTKHSLSQIQEIQKHIGFQWEDMTVNSAALKVHFTNVNIQPKKDTTKFEQEINPRKLTVQIAPWASLIKQDFILNITIEDFDYTINVSQTSNKDLFELLESAPINKIFVKSAHLKFLSPNGEILAPQTDLQLRKHRNSFYMKIKSQPILNQSIFSFQSHFYITEDQTDIISMEINNNTSQLSLTGNIPTNAYEKELFFNVESSFDANDLHTWMRHWREPLPIQGFFNIKSQIKYSNTQGFTGPFELFATNFLWNHINLSQIQMKGNFKDQMLHLEMAHFEKEKGFTSYFENTQIDLNKNKNFTLKNYSSIEDFSTVEHLLDWNSNVQFQGQLESDCTGNWFKPQLDCSMQLNMQNAYMDSMSLENPRIFEIENSKLTSKFIWTPEKSTLQGRIALGPSADKMSFEGSFENGQAEILFDGPLNFNYVQHIYGFNIQGNASQWKGKMVLKSNGVSIDSEIKTKNLYFSQYLFGNLQADLKLNTKGLYLNKIRARLGKSRYKGRLDILFKEEKIKAQAQMAPLFLEDLSQFAKDVISVPLNFIGKGNAKLSIDSPFGDLDYTVTSQFQNVKIYDEFFRTLTVDISSKKGQAQIEKAIAEKLRGSSITASGTLNKNNILNLKLTGSKLPIEKMENFNRWLNLEGILNFQMAVTGPLKKPKGDLSGTITAVQKKQLAQFKVKLTPSQIRGEGSFFNDSLLIRNFKFAPYQKTLSLSATAKDWDFIQLTKTNSPGLVVSKLTGEASLHFSQDFKKPSGFADVKELSVQYGLNQPGYADPFYVEFNKGRFSFRGSDLKWKTNEHEITVTKIDPNNSQISGTIGLEIFSLFFPHIKNIGGSLQTDLKIKNDLNKFSPEGSLKVENGMIDINNHINPFQSVELTGRLKSQVMRINQLTARTPLGGSVSAEGLIDFSEPGLLPMDISAQLNDKVAVYISDKIHGVGYGAIKIYGDKAPYTLSGVFNIRTGSFKQEFDSTEEQEDTAVVEPDLNTIYPFYWNLKVQFDKPFPVENTLFSSLITGSVQLNGNFLNPNASGQITFVPGGSFYIRDYDFEITSGRLNYNSQSIYEPQLQIIGINPFEETRYDNERETINRYNITADITGTPSNFRFELSSQPALSESDILSMMALGARSIGDSSGLSPAQIAQSQVAKYSYAQLGAVLFHDIFGRELNKSLGLRLSFTPYMSMSKNKPSSKIGIHKRWFEKMNTSYIGSVERDYDSFKVEYMLSPAFSLLGIWEKKEMINQDQSNTLGVEFEYQLDF
ncbi:MAG: translocation/assembly module TamB domain-containing protein [Bdellovibrionales bacterium]|nr:translocation/assembly module TamB domain-containing protein [Bdellovibrionales bacterium]